MSVKKSNKIFGLLIIAIALLCSSLIGGLNISNAYALDLGQKHDFFQVEILDKEDNSLSSKKTIQYQYGSTSSDVAKAYVYDVSKTYNFKLKFNFSDAATTEWGDTQPTSIDSKYTLKIETLYLKHGYSSAPFYDNVGNTVGAVAINENTYTMTEEEGYKDFANETYKIQIQSNQTINWGIYRFKMTLSDDLIFYSDYFVLEPTTSVKDKPVIMMTDDGIDSYTFSINPDTEEYKYADERQIKWYVFGKTNEGKNYALTPTDLKRSDFIELNANDKLYDDSFERNGYSLTLPKPDLKDGEWQVWCEFTPKNSAVTTKSDVCEFVIGDAGNIPFFWIIGSVAVAGIGITILIAALKTKREKIY
ncbi:MAG: hypothetical protein IJY90_01995 [Clostridia bacterium]|nr:hypothetical protein [Clostridia bacterium]